MPETYIAERVAAAAKPAAQNTANMIASKLGDFATDQYDRALNHLQAGFEEYLIRTSYRCSHIRTLIKRNESIPLDDIYVHQFLGESVRKKDDDLIDEFNDYKRLVVTGYAGCGKSLFMKYAFLTTIEKDKFAMPIFYELRFLNDTDLYEGVLEDAIAEHVSKADLNFRTKRVQQGLRDGLFALFFDGFDELRPGKRKMVEHEILRLSDLYPGAPIIVSSRPNEKFSSWEDFTVLPIRSMDFDQVTALIDKIPFDQDVKYRFKESLEKGLFNSHRSFLSNPLLSTMMLLTFDQVGEIPKKMHVFYENCFDVLTREHDSLKRQFVRELFSGLSPDEFKDVFMYFSVVTYFDSFFTLGEEKMKEYVRKAISLSEYSVSPSSIIHDMVEGTSLIQQEGRDYRFIHRSFQEYFTARFIVSETMMDLRTILRPVKNRFREDNVILLAFDMDQYYMEQNYILPELSELKRHIEQMDVRKSPVSFLRLFYSGIVVEPPVEADHDIDDGSTVGDEPGIGFVLSPGTAEFDHLMFLLNKLYSRPQDDERGHIYRSYDAEKHRHDYDIVRRYRSEEGWVEEIEDADNYWLRMLYLVDLLEAQRKAIMSHEERIRHRNYERKEKLSEMFFHNVNVDGN